MTTTMLPPALSSLDVRSFYEAHGAIVSGKPTNSKEGKEWASSCPKCGGTDRFSFWESGRFNCVRGCGWHGSSPYWFLRDQGYDHRQACQEVGIDPSEMFGERSGNRLPLFLTKDEAPNAKWMDAAAAFCRMAEKCLWSRKGESARNYLHSRGFKDETIKAAHLGLCPDWHKAPLEDWGLSAEQLGKSDDPQIKVPRGITIPWHIDGAIWKIQIRRPEPGPTGKYYFEVIGSSDCLYNLDSLQPGQPVLLVESELDALSAQQEASDLVTAIATGSTAKGRASRWIGRLKQASQVLQAFDIDENRAGERAADEWLKALPNAMRWAPWAHDVNDMLRDGQSIHDWIEMGLILSQSEGPFSAEELAEQGELVEMQEFIIEESGERILLQATPPAPDTSSEIDLIAWQERLIQQFQEHPCISCGGTDWMIDTDGHLVCPCILEKRKQPLLSRQAPPAQTIHYCPHCQKAGRKSVGGVEIARRGDNPWAHTHRKVPGGQFSYVWIESQQFWMCPGCLDQQKELA